MDGDELRAALANALMAERAHVVNVEWKNDLRERLSPDGFVERSVTGTTTRVSVVVHGRLGADPSETDLRNELHNLVRRIVEIDRLLGGSGIALVALDRALETTSTKAAP
jgi:Fe2+ transport system protein FeoA